jgi:predicted lipoprotein with Yx(FWY)xxD motif
LDLKHSPPIIVFSVGPSSKESIVKRIAYTAAGLIAVLVALGTFAVSGSSAKTRSTASATVISTRHTSLGATLVDGQGRTLYLFDGDRPNVSMLSQAGLAVWPTVTATGAPVAKGGVNASKIGTILTHGHRQVTYDHHPLYIYVGDQKPGDTKGQGLNEFGALWYVLSPTGTAVTASPRTPVSSSTSSASSSTSAGWGY